MQRLVGTVPSLVKVNRLSGVAPALFAIPRSRSRVPLPVSRDSGTDWSSRDCTFSFLAGFPVLT